MKTQRIFQKGQRVVTPLGLGTVVGFEVFPDGKAAEVVDVDAGDGYYPCRVVVALDDPEAWIGRTDEFPHPFFFRKEVEHVPE
ncbi:hypothetical protein D9M69_451990 [compost metagenome]